MRTPAEIVIDVCGGHEAVAEMCGVHLSRVYRWTYPIDRGGTGGVIPTKHQGKLLEAARERNIPLKPEHFFAGEQTEEPPPGRLPRRPSHEVAEGRSDSLGNARGAGASMPRGASSATANEPGEVA